MAGDHRLAIADDRRADIGPQTVSADQRRSLDFLAAREFDTDARSRVVISGDFRRGAQFDLVHLRADIEENCVQIGPMDHRVGFAEDRRQRMPGRHAEHFLARQAVHHDHVFREPGDIMHRRLDLQRIESAMGVGAKLNARADFAELIGLFQNDGFAPGKGQHPRGGQAADAAAGNDNGFVVGHASLFFVFGRHCKV